jgi:two-component sensor histidine kinase
MHVWQQSAKHAIDQQRIIEKSLAEKEVLLKEIHHRVKNNMQIMSSLVNLESAKIEDETLIPHLMNIKDRIRTISLVHEHLYHSESFSSIDLKEHIDELARLLVGNFHSRGCRVDVENKIPSLRVELGTAISLGLIYNEIFTNSLKYAFFDRNHGTLCLDYDQYGDEFVLAVSDNGIGIDPGIQLETATSTGMTIIRSLVDQLGGHASLRNNSGTHYELRFPAALFTLSP